MPDKSLSRKKSLGRRLNIFHRSNRSATDSQSTSWQTQNPGTSRDAGWPLPEHPAIHPQHGALEPKEDLEPARRSFSRLSEHRTSRDTEHRSTSDSLAGSTNHQRYRSDRNSTGVPSSGQPTRNATHHPYWGDLKSNHIKRESLSSRGPAEPSRPSRSDAPLPVPDHSPAQRMQNEPSRDLAEVVTNPQVVPPPRSTRREQAQEGTHALKTANQGARIPTYEDADTPTPPQQGKPWVNAQDNETHISDGYGSHPYLLANTVAHSNAVADNDMIPRALTTDETAQEVAKLSTSMDQVTVQEHPDVYVDHVAHDDRAAVTHEHVRPHIHEIKQVQRTRSWHFHDRVDIIQPIRDPDPELLPAMHWAEDPDTGKLFRIPDALGKELMESGQAFHVQTTHTRE